MPTERWRQVPVIIASSWPALRKRRWGWPGSSANLLFETCVPDPFPTAYQGHALRPRRSLPVFQMQSWHPAELSGIGSDECQTGGSGMTCQENVVRTDHATLRFEQSANTPGFPGGLSVKGQFAYRGQQQVDLGQLLRGIGTLFNAGVQLVGGDAGYRAVHRRHGGHALQHQRVMAHCGDAH